MTVITYCHIYICMCEYIYMYIHTYICMLYYCHLYNSILHISIDKNKLCSVIILNLCIILNENVYPVQM